MSEDLPEPRPPLQTTFNISGLSAALHTGWNLGGINSDTFIVLVDVVNEIHTPRVFDGLFHFVAPLLRLAVLKPEYLSVDVCPRMFFNFDYSTIIRYRLFFVVVTDGIFKHGILDLSVCRVFADSQSVFYLRVFLHPLIKR